MLNDEGLTGIAVEVGVDQGAFAEKMLSVWNGRVYLLVDPWKHFIDSDMSQEQFDSIANQVCERFKHNDRTFIHRTTSIISAQGKESNSLDFVYIDANHDYEHCKQDIAAWYPLVKIGGYLAGHDYDNDKGVVKAVNEFCIDRNINLQIIHEPTIGSSWYFKKT
jgi:hypothetical protein